MSTNDPSWPTGDDGEQSPPTPPPAPSSSTPPPPPAPSAGSPFDPPANQPVFGRTGASIGIRFGARVIDAIILGIAGLVLGFVLPLDSLFLSGLVGAIIGMGYYVGMETSSGATVGKQVLNLKVVGASGGNPTPEESFKRNIFGAFGIVPFIGGIASFVAAIAVAITVSSSPENRGWHDEFGGTTVLRG